MLAGEHDQLGAPDFGGVPGIAQPSPLGTRLTGGGPLGRGVTRGRAHPRGANADRPPRFPGSRPRIVGTIVQQQRTELNVRIDPLTPGSGAVIRSCTG